MQLNMDCSWEIRNNLQYNNGCVQLLDLRHCLKEMISTAV